MTYLRPLFVTLILVFSLASHAGIGTFGKLIFKKLEFQKLAAGVLGSLDKAQRYVEEISALSKYAAQASAGEFNYKNADAAKAARKYLQKDVGDLTAKDLLDFHSHLVYMAKVDGNRAFKNACSACFSSRSGKVKSSKINSTSDELIRTFDDLRTKTTKNKKEELLQAVRAHFDQFESLKAKEKELRKIGKTVYAEKDNEHKKDLIFAVKSYLFNDFDTAFNNYVKSTSVNELVERNNEIIKFSKLFLEFQQADYEVIVKKEMRDNIEVEYNAILLKPSDVKSDHNSIAKAVYEKMGGVKMTFAPFDLTAGPNNAMAEAAFYHNPLTNERIVFLSRKGILNIKKSQPLRHELLHAKLTQRLNDLGQDHAFNIDIINYDGSIYRALNGNDGGYSRYMSAQEIATFSLDAKKGINQLIRAVQDKKSTDDEIAHYFLDFYAEVTMASNVARHATFVSDQIRSFSSKMKKSVRKMNESELNDIFPEVVSIVQSENNMPNKVFINIEMKVNPEDELSTVSIFVQSKKFGLPKVDSDVEAREFLHKLMTGVIDKSSKVNAIAKVMEENLTKVKQVLIDNGLDLREYEGTGKKADMDEILKAVKKISDDDWQEMRKGIDEVRKLVQKEIQANK